jgi:hypothetical protein
MQRRNWLLSRVEVRRSYLTLPNAIAIAVSSIAAMRVPRSSITELHTATIRSKAFPLSLLCEAISHYGRDRERGLFRVRLVDSDTA